MNLFSYVFALGRVVSSRLLGQKNVVGYTVTGMAQDGDAGNAETSNDNRAFAPIGWYGRPDQANDDGVCDQISVRFGDSLIPIGFNDIRVAKRTNPAEGAWGIAHYGGGYFDLRWSRDKLGTVIAISAPHLDGNGNIDSSHYLSMDPADANSSIILAHRMGHALTFTKAGEVVINSPDNKQSFIVSNQGITLGGKMNFFGGIVAGTSTLAKPVLLSPDTVNLLTALLTALAAAFSAPTAAPGAPLNAGWATGVVPALQALLNDVQTQGTAQTLKASPT